MSETSNISWVILGNRVYYDAKDVIGWLYACNASRLAEILNDVHNTAKETVRV